MVCLRRHVNDSNQLLWSYEIRRLAKCRVDHPPHGITRCGELIAVAVAQIDRDPVVRDRLVELALEIAVAYVEKIIALKYAARRYPKTPRIWRLTSSSESRSSMGACVREMRSVTVSHNALAVWRPPAFSKVIPFSVSDRPFCKTGCTDGRYRAVIGSRRQRAQGRPGGREPPAYLLFSLSPRAFR